MVSAMTVVTQSIARRSEAAVAELRHVRLASIEAVAAERPVWDALVQDHYAENPFLGLEWHLLWLSHFARAPGEIHCVKILENGIPIAYFPLCLRRERIRGVPARVLRYAGNIYSPLNGPVIGHWNKKKVVNYFVQRVLPEIGWDLLVAADLPPEMPGAVELHDGLQQAGYRVAMEKPIGNWIFEQPGITAPDYFRQLKYNLRNDTRRFPKKLATIGDLNYRLVSGDLSRADIDAYRTVYERSWKQPEMDPTFHPHLMQVAAAAGKLRLGFLYLDERPIAAQLWLYARPRGYVVKTAYDEEFRTYSPGTLLTWWIIERLMANEQMMFFDFLRGDDEYKKYWTNQRRERLNLLAYPRTARGRFLYLVDQWALPWVRRHPTLSRWKALLGRSGVRRAGSN